MPKLWVDILQHSDSKGASFKAVLTTVSTDRRERSVDATTFRRRLCKSGAVHQRRTASRIGETNPTQESQASQCFAHEPVRVPDAGGASACRQVYAVCASSTAARVVHRWSGTVASSECATIPGRSASRKAACCAAPGKRRYPAAGPAFWPNKANKGKVRRFNV